AFALHRVLPAQTGKLFSNRGDGVQHVRLARAADSEFRAMRRLTAGSDSRVTLGELLHGGLRRFRILKGNPLISLTNRQPQGSPLTFQPRRGVEVTFRPTAPFFDSEPGLIVGWRPGARGGRGSLLIPPRLEQWPLCLHV